MKKLLPLALLVLASCSSSCSSSSARESAAKDDEPVAMSVIPLQFAAAADVARALDRVTPSTRVIADGRTNSVLVTCASAAEMEQVEAVVAKLDVRVQ